MKCQIDLGTPLNRAIYYGNISQVENLLEEGADYEADGCVKEYVV